MAMSSEQLEYAISQYLDGTLKPLELATLEHELHSSGMARALLEEYRAIDALLKLPCPLPNLDWDRLEGALCAGIADATPPVPRSVIFMRLRWAGAVAACLVVSASIALWSEKTPVPGVRQISIAVGPPASTPVNANLARMNVALLMPGQTGFHENADSTPPGTVASIAQIQVGPDPQLVAGGAFADGPVVAPTHVMIAAGNDAVGYNPNGENDFSPF